jgi:hypothetical protein
MSVGIYKLQIWKMNNLPMENYELINLGRDQNNSVKPNRQQEGP